MAQGSEFPLRKPPGFHYDFFLLGITTVSILLMEGFLLRCITSHIAQFIAGLIGVPAPNGLIPQAPIHTTSLLVIEHLKPEKDEEERKSAEIAQTLDYTERPIAVVEQRVSNLAQGALCLVLLTGPFLHVLHLIPRGAHRTASFLSLT